MRFTPHPIGIGLLALFIGNIACGYDIHHPNPMSILNGRFHRPRSSSDEDNTSKPQPWRMYKQRKESKYVLKPEPYSLTAKKGDPELLGPQRTYQTQVSTSPNQTHIANPSTPTTPPKPTITREACLALIGQEKFDQYTQKYGGEKGALRRCLILKRSR
jgi:hypothetical protein